MRCGRRSAARETAGRGSGPGPPRKARARSWNIPQLTGAGRIHNYPGRTGRLMTSVTISESAARRIGGILKTEPEGAMLRVSVDGGGCSVFQYKFVIEQAKADDDLVLARDAALVLIDAATVKCMTASHIGIVDVPISQ